jgi:mono/diheme cytochrome c family protein
VRQTAVRVAERRLAAGDETLLEALRPLAKDRDLDVRVQLLQSLRFCKGDSARELAVDLVLAHGDCELVRAVGATTLGFGEEAGATTVALDVADLERFRAGKAHYATLCTACHGADGSGAQAPDGLRLAPPLRGSARLCGDERVVLRVVLRGMSGAVDGVTYPGNLMAPMHGYDDDWLAGVLTYARNAWGNRAPAIRPDAVARVRAATADRVTPFTVEEVDRCGPVPRAVMAGWKLSASHTGEDCARAIDGDPGTRFTTGQDMRPGMRFAIDFGEPWLVEELVLDTSRSPGDWPRGFEVRLSDDGEAWGEPVATGAGDGPVTRIRLAGSAASRHLCIVQTGSADGLWWSIHELQVFGGRAR